MDADIDQDKVENRFLHQYLFGRYLCRNFSSMSFGEGMKLFTTLHIISPHLIFQMR